MTSSPWWYPYRKIIKIVVIDTGVTTIDIEAFAACYNLISVTIPNTIIIIGDGAFRACENLASVTIPNSVNTIEDYTFYGCESLTSITIPNSIIKISPYTFNDCRRLSSIIIPNSVTDIGIFAFQNCTSLLSVIIPNSVTTIGHFTFSGCSSLMSVTIPNSVASIREGAFGFCSSLNTITIPNSVETIYNSAFSYCTGLTSITSYSKTPPVLGTDVFYNVPADIPVYILCGMYNSYSSASGWRNFYNFTSPYEEMPTITKNGNVLTSSEAYSYQWYLDNEPIDGATEQSYTYTQNGTYYVEIINEYSCSSYSEEIPITDVSITHYELPNTNYVIFPNPTTGKLRITNYDNSITNYELRITDIVGQVVLTSSVSTSSPETTIDISNLANGVYFMKINNKITKIIKH